MHTSLENTERCFFWHHTLLMYKERNLGLLIYVTYILHNNIANWGEWRTWNLNF